MYLICYLGMGTTICVHARVATAAEITPIINAIRDNESRSSLKASDVFVLTSVIYPEKR